MSNCCFVTSEHFSPISWQERGTFDGMMMMMFALFEIDTLNWIFIVLCHYNNSPQVDMPLHSDTFS